MLIGALYRGADAHVSYKGGGSEMAQIALANCGVVTTSERSKQLIAHSNHVGLQFFALMWQNLPMEDWADDDNSSSDDITFWSKKRRTQEQADELSATANP